MRKRTHAALLALVAAGTVHAEVPLSRSLKKAMLDDADHVPVVVRWKANAQRPQLLSASDVPAFGISAATLSEARIQELAKSDAVDAIYHDAPMPLEQPDIPKTVDELDAQEHKLRRTWGLAAIGADRVHAELGITGKGVRVGIVDTGIDGLHPFFRDKLRGFKDFTGVLSPEADDTQGHGSHVAGTIAGGITPDGVAIGVAPGCELVVSRVLGPRQGRLSMILAGMAYVTESGARVINCSFGSSGSPESDPLWNDVLGYLASRNVLPVVAAGNDGRNGPGTVGSPGYLEGSFTVGAVRPDLQRADFSSYSEEKLGNRPKSYLKPDIAAPGFSVLSTREKNVIGRMNGTSMATPHVVGVVALMLEANPSLTPPRIREIIEETATDLGDTGRDSQYGAGLINAYKAVSRAKELVGAPVVQKSDDDLLTEGQRLMVGNNLPAAASRFMQIVQRADWKDTKVQAAAYYLSEAYYHQGNFRGAVNGFAKLAELAPKSEFGIKAVFQVAKSYKETPVDNPAQTNLTYTKAAEWFSKFIAENPDHEWVPTAMIEVANSYASLNQPDRAKQVLGAFLQRFAGHPEAAHAYALMEKLEGGTRDPLAQ